MTQWKRIIATIACCLAPALTPDPAQSASSEQETGSNVITIFAASSFGPALEEIAEAIAKRRDTKVRVSIASSSALARQIEKGAPADIFISADRRWIRHLKEQIGLSDQNVFPVATNRLVVAARQDRAGTEQGAAPTLLEDPDAWIAIGDPALSPLGAYTMEALRAMGLEDRLSGRLAFAADARATLVFLQTGGVPLAILYGSDTQSARRIAVVSEIDPSLHRPIVYFAAALRNSAETTAFLDYLKGPDAQKVLAARGFGPAIVETGQE